jgi:hypothetical protein
MAAASSKRISFENRQYAFENFSSKVMKQGYRDFFDQWFSNSGKPETELSVSYSR